MAVIRVTKEVQKDLRSRKIHERQPDNEIVEELLKSNTPKKIA